MKVVKVKRKYVPMRVPVDVYDEAVKVKGKLEKAGQEILGKPVRIPLTRVLRIKMKTPTTIPDYTLKKILKKKI